MKIWGKSYVCNIEANRLSDQPPPPPLAWIGGTANASVAVDLEPYCEWQDIAADDAGVPRFGEI